MSLKASPTGLTMIRQIRENRGWAIDNPQWLEEASKFLPLVRNGRNLLPGGVAIGTWKRFLAGTPIRTNNFQAFCQVLGLNWEEVVDRDVSTMPKHLDKDAYARCDWGEAIDCSVFYGRTEELATLEQWIVTDKCRLVTLLGMGGMGKTALSVKLAQQIEGEFDYLIWRSLQDAPPLNDILSTLLQFLSQDGTHATAFPENTSQKITLLIEYLRCSRCLLVLDNCESILQGGAIAGQYREDARGYGELIRRVGETSHQSCLVLTSRENPQELAALEGDTLPIRSLQLTGLTPEEGQLIFQAKGSFSATTDEWKEVIQHYAGNPLALKIVASGIREIFGGKIYRLLEYVKSGIVPFADISQLLERQFNRMNDCEKEVIYWLAINREPIYFSDLQDDILSSNSQYHLSDALHSLKRKSLIEFRGNEKELLALQPVVMECAIARLIDKVCEEIETGKLSAINSCALLKAQTKDYIINAQIRLILKPVTARLVDIFRGKNNVKNRLSSILLQWRSQYPQAPGYAAGNIINLLYQMNGDLNGYDFSNLIIWQAYLRGASLQNTNFAGCDLSKSVFTDILGPVLSLAYSSDGELLAAGGQGEIHLWQVANGQKMLTIDEGHSGWVRSIAFSPDGNTLASGSLDKIVRLWDIKTGKSIKFLQGHADSIRSVAFSPDGKILASGSADNTVRLWEVETDYQSFKTLSGHTDEVHSIAFSPDGATLASSSYDKTVILWNVSVGKSLKIFHGHGNWIKAVAFSPDGKTLATGSDDNTVRSRGKITPHF